VQSDPAAMMDQAWAEEVVARALTQLQMDCERAGRGHVFVAVRPVLSCDPDTESYAAIAEKLEITVQNVKITVHRLRKRLSQLIRDEVKQTVGSGPDWEDELRYLIRLME